jgi:hypothetical protein
MTRQRSYADARAGQQLYAVLTSCRRPQALWDKLATGHYDWLGVRANGRYVLGRPRLATVPQRPPSVHREPGADGSHRVEYRGPLDRSPHQEWHATEDAAQDGFARIIADDPGSPIASSGVWHVRLYLRGVLAAEELVVRRLPKLV